MIHKGAYILLITIVIVPIFGWSITNLVEAMESIATLKAREKSQRELILSVDLKIDKHNLRFDRINNKLDKIIFEIKKN